MKRCPYCSGEIQPAATLSRSRPTESDMNPMIFFVALIVGAMTWVLVVSLKAGEFRYTTPGPYRSRHGTRQEELAAA